jgi:hypothetical protein
VALLHRVICLLIGVIGSVCLGLCQQPGNPPQPYTVAASETTNSTERETKRIFGIIPNNRTSPTLHGSEPLTSRGKFTIATEDAFDRGSFALAAIFAGEAQLTNANRSFGQGAAGYGKYFGAAFGDLTIADYMTEAIYPSLLHQDPRYFRKGTGSGWSRLGYAMGQIFWTHTDSGGTQFNFSEVIGNSTAVAISNAYYSDNRTASDAMSKLGTQLGIDMASNILKEFWPDIAGKFQRKHNSQTSSSTH